eukprot:scaffold2425_cov306-Prasinococcus_capsulatus_cf.AAC.1
MAGPSPADPRDFRPIWNIFLRPGGANRRRDVPQRASKRAEFGHRLFAPSLAPLLADGTIRRRRRHPAAMEHRLVKVPADIWPAVSRGRAGQSRVWVSRLACWPLRGG